jgi:hypothetical protein
MCVGGSVQKSQFVERQIRIEARSHDCDCCTQSARANDALHLRARVNSIYVGFGYALPYFVPFFPVKIERSIASAIA